MVKHVWSVLCRRSVIDKESNNLSIYDVFEQLNVGLKIRQGTPQNVFNIPIDFEVVSLWVKDNKKEHYKGDFEIEVVNPSGRTAKIFGQKLEMPSEMRRLRSVVRIKGLVVDEGGDYLFKVNIKKEGEKTFETVIELPLEVNLSKQDNDQLLSNKETVLH